MSENAAAEQARQRAHEIYDPIAGELCTRDGVDIGPLFGTEGLRIRGKVFAFVTHGSLVVKLPHDRIDELEASGAAERMTMRERRMKEWALVGPESASLWHPLAVEGLTFVDGITP